MSNDIQMLAGTPLALTGFEAKPLVAALVEYDGDRCDLEAKLTGTAVAATCAKLVNAWAWGVENPAMTKIEVGKLGGRGNKSQGDRTLVADFSQNTQSRYRKIARVPRDRLEAWVENQLAKPKPTLRIGHFEKSQPYVTEDVRDALAEMGSVCYDHLPNVKEWTSAMTQHTFLKHQLRLMDMGVDEFRAKMDANDLTTADAEEWQRVQNELDGLSSDGEKKKKKPSKKLTLDVLMHQCRSWVETAHGYSGADDEHRRIVDYVDSSEAVVKATSYRFETDAPGMLEKLDDIIDFAIKLKGDINARQQV